MSAEEFTSLLATGDAKAVANFFQGMPEKERRTFVKPLREFLKSVGWAAMERDDWRDFHDRRRLAGYTLAPAAMAVFPSAATTATFLRSVQRSELLDPQEAEAVQQILAERAPEWSADLPAILLDTLEAEGVYRLVQAVRDVSGVHLEASRAYVRAWGLEFCWSGDDEQAKAEILGDPRLAELLPLVFDDDENDDLFTSWSLIRIVSITAVEQGLVPRGDVLDACLRRLLRGGRTGAMQDQLTLWNSLEVTDAEVVERVSSCISLLSSQAGTVARTFLAALKKASDAGLLDVELAVEAASIAVTRPEKNVVKTTLGWLDGLGAAHPERAGQLAEAVALSFGARAADLQERAVKLVGKHAKGLGEDSRRRLVAEGQVYLAPDLAARLAEVLGVSAAEVDGDAGYPEVALYVPRPLLPPIGSPAELAEVIASLMHRDPVEAMVFERVLEAIVVFERSDAAGLREALAPVVERWPQVESWDLSTTVQTPRSALSVLAAAAAGVNESARRHPHRAGVNQLWSRVRKMGRGWWRRTRTSPADFLVLRAAEIQAALGMPDLPPLVSVPTSPSGAIAPEALAARLRECEARGWVPLEADFHQALLRLPADCGEAGLDVGGFTSTAGLRFAAWVGGAGADGSGGVGAGADGSGGRGGVGGGAGVRVELPAAEMPDPAAWHFTNKDRRDAYMRTATRHHVKDPATLLDLVRGVWSEPERCWDQSDWAVCWPAIVPSRPDLAAMAMIGGVDYRTAAASPESAVTLAEQDGPQAATHHVIAARLVADDARLRASGVDAALVLAARGLLDPAELSEALARQVGANASGLRRTVPGLRDLANGGAARETWQMVALLLPGILPPALPKAQPGTADLLVLATDLAGALTIRTPITEVSALAGKKGGSAVGNAARRLEGVLGAG